MISILDVGALLALAVLGYLLWLLLFEQGVFYRVTMPVHRLRETEFLDLLSKVLGASRHWADAWQLFNQGAGFYAAELGAIRSARRSIHIEAYILQRSRIADELLAALIERAGSGVNIRMVLDAVGSLGTPDEYFAQLRAAGGQVHWYHPIRWHTIPRLNNRTHRNLMIIDGCRGFVGGAGFAEYWSRSDQLQWRDTMLALEGEICAGLQAVFAENWLECTGEILSGDDSFPPDAESPGIGLAPLPGLVVGSTPAAGRSTRARMLMQLLLAAAQDSILISSPYFIPDFGIRRELLAARARGVRVCVITGGPYSDHGLVRRAGRKRYGVLLQQGVEILEYSSRMMHAKVLLVDGRYAALGSTNFDHRSFGLNDEVNAVLVSKQLGDTLRADFIADAAASDQLTYAAWLRRSRWERALAWLGTVIERHQ